MRIIEGADLPLAAFQRSLEARAAEAREALARLPARPPGATAPAVPFADVVTLSPEARALARQLLRQPPDLPALAALLREALRQPAGPAFAALRDDLLRLGAPPARLPPSPAALAALLAALRTAIPALAADDHAAHLAAAWLLAGGPRLELPPALLSLLAAPPPRRREPPRRKSPGRTTRQA